MYRKILNTELKVDKSTGYQYFIDKTHPLATGNSYRVYYHRHLASIKQSKWITSQYDVHHIDGNKLNNSLENLEILSKEEHAKLHNITDYTIKVCPICSTEFTISASRVHRVHCSVLCAAKSQEHITISKELLEVLIWHYPYQKVGNQVGLSDVGVKKKAKALSCKIPPAYFFNKSESFRESQRKQFNIPPLSSIG